MISADDLTKAQSELLEEELEGVAGGQHIFTNYLINALLTLRCYGVARAKT